MYEKYVEDLISRGMYKLTIEINKLLISQSVNYDNVLFSPLSIASECFLDTLTKFYLKCYSCRCFSLGDARIQRDHF